MARSGVVCLLPARNAAADLPGFFDSATQICDAIVALDDGSTDATAEILAAHPLVQTLLTNPQRPDYRGWDDAANRNRLLDAAAPFEPEWILSLDADERIDPSDTAALRDFLATDALPGCAYGFRHVPMRGDADHFVARYQWVWRLFAFAQGQRFPTARLHFAPVPTSIPRERWFRTTLRIQHLGGMTGERRLARFAKYLEADPARDYQADYSTLLRTPAGGELRRWVPRPPGLPVLLTSSAPDDEDPGPLPPADDPGTSTALSAIIIARNDEATIARTVSSVVDQNLSEPFDVVVVTSGTDRTAAIVREQFPTVTLVELDRPALPGEARNAGLRRAQGAYISFPGSHVELPPGSLVARLAAHRRGYAMVTGVAVNGTPTPAGWASYFIDHHAGLPGHRPAELDGPPAHCSYAHLPLLEVGGFPEGIRTGEDTAVNRALVRRGYVAYRDPAVRFTHRSPCRTLPKLLRHHFARGRGWGRLLVDEHRERGRLLNREVFATRLIRHVPSRVRRINHYVGEAEPELQQHHRRVAPLVLAGVTASWAGMWWEILRPARGKAAILLGHPIYSVLVLTEGQPSPTVLRVDRIGREVQSLGLPPSLPVSASESGDLQPLSAVLHAALATSGGKSSTALLDHLRAIVRLAVDLDLDGVLAGPAELVARVVGPLAQPDRAATAPSRSWLSAILVSRRRDVTSSLGPLRLGALTRDLRRFPTAVSRAADLTTPSPPRVPRLRSFEPRRAASNTWLP